MENINNEETVIETPIVDEAPVAEPAKIEEVVAVEEPKVEELKIEEPKAEESSVIGAPRFPSTTDTVQAVGVTNNGAIGTTEAPKAPKKAPVAPKKGKSEEKVAIHSTRNVTWPGVGKVYRGYNILSKSEAEQWLTRDHCRTATPEEVAKGYGK